MSDRHESARWRCQTKLERYEADIDDYRRRYGKEEGERRFFAEHKPAAVEEQEGNLLMYGGVSCLWEALIGATRTGNQLPFDNTNAYLGVGDSSTAEAATQTDLQASSNKLRKAMDATYPQHTDGTTSGAASIVYKSTFGTSDANFAWQEWGLFNGSSAGRMLNRKVSSLGTKTSAASWAFTITLSLS